jgi:uncharacterized membrane protein
MDRLVAKKIPMSPPRIACAVLVSLLWGLQFVVIKVGLTAFPPLFFVALRFAAVAAILLPFVGRPTRRELGPMIATSVFLGGLNFALFFAGLEQGLASVSAVANQLSTPFTVLLAWPFLGERPSTRVIIGVALAFGGVALTVAEPSASVKIVPTLLQRFKRTIPFCQRAPDRQGEASGDNQLHRSPSHGDLPRDIHRFFLTEARQTALMMSTMLKGFRHRMVRVGDVNIHAVIGGEGPPLALLHGFPQTWWEWRRVMPRLAETNTVVAVDLRGAGHSDCPQGGYDKVTMAADVHGVMQALEFERYAVCGHDIGAVVALAQACTYRSAITRLAVLDASQPGWSGWEANCAKHALWHFAFHQKRDLLERLLFGREYDYVSTFISDRAFGHAAHTVEDMHVFASALA